MEQPLKSVFYIKKKPFDFYLNNEEITWTPQVDEQSGKYTVYSTYKYEY